MTRGAAFVSLTLGLLFCSCQESPERTRFEIASRLFEEGGEPLPLARLQRPIESYRFTFSEPNLPSGWTAIGRDRPTVVGRPPDKGEDHLLWEAGFPASDVSTVEVTVRRKDRGTVTLEWVHNSEQVDSHPWLEADAKPGVQTVVFDLWAEPDWRGPIETLRLRARGGEILEVVARRFVLDAGNLENIVGRAWKLDVENDVRDARLALPGLELEREVVVSAGDRLRLEFALQSGVRRRVAFRALVSGASGQDLLFARTLDPQVAEDRGWQSAEFDLTAYDGQAVRLSLETEAPSFDPVFGFPAWANPQVIRSVRRLSRPNVVLISIDTLRADRMSLYGHSKNTTPSLSAWASRSAAVFENAIAQAAWTLPSHVSMLTGMNAFRHGVNHNTAAPASLTTLAELLRSAGYATLAVTGGAFVHPEYGLGQGFERFVYWPGRRPDKSEELEPGIDLALEWLERDSRAPFFLFFHTYEVHHRSVPRWGDFERFSDRQEVPRLRMRQPTPAKESGFMTWREMLLVEPTEQGWSQRPLPEELRDLPYEIYDSRVAFADRQIGRLLTRLEELSLAEKTVVIVTSDHGELLGEHSLFGHQSVYEENLRIPLAVALPDRRGAGKRLSPQVRSVDILPTVLEAIGQPVPDGVDGRSLVSLMTTGSEDQRRTAWTYAGSTNWGLSLRVDNRWKYIFKNAVWAPIRGEEELYDLSEDPAEQVNLRHSAPQLQAMRRQALNALEQDLPSLRLQIANPDREPIDLRLRGSPMRQRAIKSTDLPCDCLAIEKGAGVRVHVPAGAEFILMLETAQPDSVIEVQRESETEQSPSVKIDLASLTGVLELRLDGMQWVLAEGAALESPTATLRFWWHGETHPATGESPEDRDRDLRRRLEALGYL